MSIHLFRFTNSERARSTAETQLADFQDQLNEETRLKLQIQGKLREQTDENNRLQEQLEDQEDEKNAANKNLQTAQQMVSGIDRFL